MDIGCAYILRSSKLCDIFLGHVFRLIIYFTCHGDPVSPQWSNFDNMDVLNSQLYYYSFNDFSALTAYMEE